MTVMVEEVANRKKILLRKYDNCGLKVESKRRGRAGVDKLVNLDAHLRQLLQPKTGVRLL